MQKTSEKPGAVGCIAFRVEGDVLMPDFVNSLGRHHALARGLRIKMQEADVLSDCSVGHLGTPAILPHDDEAELRMVTEHGLGSCSDSEQ